jgi:hypothetical protein
MPPTYVRTISTTIYASPPSMTMAGVSPHVMKPMTVKEIVTKAQAFEFNPHIALKYWLRTADTILKEVREACFSHKADLTHWIDRLRFMSAKIMISKPIFS